MHLPRSHELAAELIWLDEVASTNDALRELVAAHPDQPHRTVVVTDTQTAGRGRLGREWVAPSGSALAMSILVRKQTQTMGASWLPLIAGSAVRRGLTKVLEGQDAHGVVLGVKWPNDVLASSETGTNRKLSGILSEMLPDGSVIVGIGINTALAEADLPTATATSLAVLTPGGPVAEPDTVLAAVLEEFFVLLDAVANGDDQRVKDVVTADSSTLGTRVRALLPGDTVIEGIARLLTDDGALVLAPLTTDGSEAAEVVVAAGDIEHLR
jgi:BirA family biotin operon repressor/biotin-[acetyl-CoA-carboxylase] ligase